MAPKELQRQIAADLDWLFADPRGRRILHRLFTSCHMFEATAHPFNEGRRSVALEFWGPLASDQPGLLCLLLSENLAREQHGRRDRGSRGASPDAGTGDDPADDGDAEG